MMLADNSFVGLRRARQLVVWTLTMCVITIMRVQAAPQEPVAPPAPAAETQPSALATPEVTSVDPSSAAPGKDTTLKIKGKNFAPDAKVSFANPGIRVVDIKPVSSTELAVRIKVAHDASPGASSLYVINPNDREGVAPFEVTGKGPAPPATPATPGAAAGQRYEAYHFGNPLEALQAHGKVKGALVVSARKLRYEEGNKILFNVALREVKEVEINTLGGFNTGTFHIILTSGKTYNFAPGSLHAGDDQTIVDALRKALAQ
jgi:hypothetical protein